MRLYEPNGGQIYFGRTRHYTSPTNDALKPIRKQMQMIFQDPFASLDPRLSIEQIIGEPLEIHKIGTKTERRDKIVRIARKRRFFSRRFASFPDRIFRRTAAAYRHRPRARSAPENYHLRRTRFGSRRFRAGADLESFARFAGRIRFSLSFHLAQYRRHRFYESANWRDVSRKIGGNRRKPTNHKRAATSIYANFDFRNSRTRSVKTRNLK